MAYPISEITKSALNVSPTQTACLKGDSLSQTDKHDGSSSKSILDFVQSLLFGNTVSLKPQQFVSI